MIEPRPFETLGHASHGWLNARHHFSFAGYHDPARMGWGALRVWNDDEIAPGTGFDRHGHRDMEIVTYVRKGAITHRDHLGNEGRTEAGNVQVMSAGKGILHEEHNLESERTDIFQIWILPAEPGGTPYWNAAAFPTGDRAGQLVALASGRADAPAGALPIRQDAAILGATVPPGTSVTYPLDTGRYAYVVALGAPVTVNGTLIEPRSGAAIRGEAGIVAAAPAGNDAPAEIVLADVPPAD
jgi:hypothetical protein